MTAYNTAMLDVAAIRTKREKLKISQSEAAKRAGFKTHQQWNNIERGAVTDITMSTLDKIAAALGVKAKDLLK